MKDLTKANQEAELALIGAMTLDPSCIGDVVDICSGSDYTDRSCGQVHDIIVGLWSDGRAVDRSVVAASVDPWLSGLVTEAYSAVGTAVGATFHAGLIKDASIRRDIVSESTGIVRMAQEDDRDTADVLGDAQSRLLGLSGVRTDPALGSVLAGVLKDSEAASKRKSHVSGVPFGTFSRLNALTGGMEAGDLIEIASRPSVGKTAMALNIIWDLVSRLDGHLLFFSAEMTQKAIARRLISQVSGVDSLRIRTGRLTADEMSRCVSAGSEIDDRCQGRLTIDDRKAPSLGYVVSKTRQAANSTDLYLVAFDHFHEMSLPRGAEGVVAGLDHNVRGLKSMAGNVDVPVLLMVQLNRGAETSSEMRVPVLSELKGCGALEETADLVIFPHRRTRNERFGEVILAKQRNGEVGSAGNYTYDGPTTTWKEM